MLRAFRARTRVGDNPTPLLSTAAWSRRPCRADSSDAWACSSSNITRWSTVASPPAYLNLTARNPWATADRTTALTAVRPTDSSMASSEVFR